MAHVKRGSLFLEDTKLLIKVVRSTYALGYSSARLATQLIRQEERRYKAHSATSVLLVNVNRMAHSNSNWFCI